MVLDSTGNESIYLTKREKEVLKLMIAGHSNPQIAKILSISISTVKAHVSSILRKFNVNTRVAATRDAVKKGFLD